MSEKIFTGTITEIIDPVLYQIKVNIPGIVEDILAFPVRGEIDEPRVGDFVLLRSLDPVFNSYFLYQKLKENDYIGFRSNGKMVDITPDYITIGIFTSESNSEKEGYYNDVSENDPESNMGGFRPIPTDWVTLYKDGSLDVYLRSNSTIKILGNSGINITGQSVVEIEDNSTINIAKDSNINITGNSNINVDSDSSINISGNSDININNDSNINVKGNCTMDVIGNATVKSPNITVEGSTVTITGGTLITKGSSNTDMSGPFCGIKNCAFSGVPHTGSTVSGT